MTRISKTTQMLMEGVAWCVYGVDFLINLVGDLFGVGEVISFIFMVIAVVLYIFWFYLKGVKVFDPAVLKKVWLRALVAIIPIIDVLPIFPTKQSSLNWPGFPGFVRNLIAETQEEDTAKEIEETVKNETKKKPFNRFRDAQS